MRLLCYLLFKDLGLLFYLFFGVQVNPKRFRGVWFLGLRALGVEEGLQEL